MAAYYADKLDSLRDIFGASSVTLRKDSLDVDGRTFPILDDVIVVLSPDRYPPRLWQRLQRPASARDERPPLFSEATQRSFGAEWKTFPEVLDEHRSEFEGYFDLVDLETLRDSRVADLGCGAGRWSYFLQAVCRELVLVDFSEAIFVARRNLRRCDKAIFVMGDVTQLPFREDFADMVVCLGVLHHLPVDALQVVRRLARCAPRALVYLYYALDNRPAHYRLLLRAVTGLRLLACQVRSPVARAALSWAGTAGLYVPVVAAGSLLRRVGLGQLVPLHDSYAGKSFRRIQQDVYDRFFTCIEQRFTRDEIRELCDTFEVVRVSERLPYWHFLCLRNELSPRRPGAEPAIAGAHDGFATADG